MIDVNSVALLLAAIIAVESGGNCNAYNKNENAAGCMQIRPIFVKDINRILGKERFTLADRYDKRKSKQMAMIFWSHYCVQKRLGREPTLEDLARCFNGGPDGHKKESTKAYWQKVKKELEK